MNCHKNLTDYCKLGRLLPHLSMCKMLVPYVQVQPILLLIAQLPINFLNLCRSKFTKHKPRLLPDQVITHTRILTILIGEIIQISLGNLNLWLTQQLTNPTTKGHNIKTQPILSIRTLNHLPATKVQI